LRVANGVVPASGREGKTVGTALSGGSTSAGPASGLSGALSWEQARGSRLRAATARRERNRIMGTAAKMA
jgi:hypothetical protein